MKDNKRFNNILGEEYELFTNAVYYYYDLEETIADKVSSFVNRDNLVLLEIGAGSGITTNVILEKSDKKVLIKAVDNEQKMLTQAEQILSEKIEQVELIHSDILTYLKRIPDNYFDGVYSGWTIHNLKPEIRSALFEEIGRVTKSGGFFVNGDKIATDDENKHKENYEGFVKLLNKIGESGNKELEEEWLKHYEEDELIRFTEKEQKELLEKNKFSETEVVFRELLDAVVISKKI
jgi:ubiquinone/menaquinone biosynthesis C-methylase UbiE